DCIDRCVTGPGSRLLRARLGAPLCEPDAINGRLDKVAVFFANTGLTRRVRTILKTVPDLARSLARLSLDRGGPRDLAAIAAAIAGAHELASLLNEDESETGPILPLVPLIPLGRQLADAPGELASQIGTALVSDPPVLTGEGGFIRAGHHRALDEQRELASTSRSVIADLQARYQDLTGVRNLKIKHNNVLGYFAELNSTHGQNLLADGEQKTFIHRQSLANAMRFTTLELGELESAINQASARALALELDLFAGLRQQVLASTPLLQSVAAALAEIDVAAALGHLAAEDNYCRPDVDASLEFDIQSGRHPIVERSLLRGAVSPFVANDCQLGPGEGEDFGALWLLTGPNMGGKSTYLRQNALMAILAQAGSFVPAKCAHIGVVDAVFSRVGAADDIAGGRSTFMVEMIETAAILNHATGRSLVILDEIGRGTATFDGLSIAWACVEALARRVGCRGLFATHYHEMTALAETVPSVFNYTLKVREHAGEVIFLHEVVPGAAESSYGIQVARLAGLPEDVVARARQVLDHLEANSQSNPSPGADLPLFAVRPQKKDAPGAGPLAERLAAIEPDQLTPRQAIDLVYELKALAPGEDT
ncbi:MAG: DNA mismatch repair protein MutS, partial [Alphaproteobacteria bacterium]|nr:DNA mismatch repair protein MutS [Alphaproteobacteria bacterium]